MHRLTLLSLAAALAMLGGATDRAEAVVYCKTVGVPKGCVTRPPAAAVIYCTSPGVPAGCVARPAARAVARPGLGVNAGGPVNRRGLR
jgi:hypothetical protein